MIADDTVQIWVVPLDADQDEAEGWFGSILSAGERARANAFRGETLRRDYITAHAALRIVLGRCLSIDPGRVAFRPDAADDARRGSVKPALDSESHRQGAGLSFNLSHTRGKAMIGAAWGRELGIDVEWQRPMDDLADLAGLARTVMSREELELWTSLPPGVRTQAFYHLWTRKESYLKAIGMGLYADLNSITVPVWAGVLREPQPVRDELRTGTWMVRDVSDSSLAHGYSASVCWQGEDAPDVTVARMFW